MNAIAPTALIAEDEALLARALARALQQCWPALRLAATVADGESAVSESLRLLPDVVFLDIRMPGRSGLEAAAAISAGWPLGRPQPLMVFVTAYDEFAVSAFEQAALDYLLKPVTRERLTVCVERVQARLDTHARLAEQSQLADALQRLALQLGAGAGGRAQPVAAAAADAEPSPAPRLEVLRAGSGNTVRMIPVGEVLYFEARDKYVSVVTASGEALIRMRLHELAEQIDPTRFVQIHRGVLVNRDCIERATRDDDGGWRLSLRGSPAILRVSRAFAHHFRPM